MASLLAQQLLTKLSNLSLKEREVLSKDEIIKIISEIKYLTSQKKIPKITLRKEIVHLENHLQGVFSLEETLIEREHKEMNKIKVMKKHIDQLKKQLIIAKDKELHRKVEKLSHLIGDTLAKEDTHKKIITEAKVAKLSDKVSDKNLLKDKNLSYAQALQQRLSALKQSLAAYKSTGEIMNPEKVNQLELQISLVEQKLNEFYEVYPFPKIEAVQPPTGLQMISERPTFTIPAPSLILPAQQPPPPVINDKRDVKHIMLFGPQEKMPEEEQKNEDIKAGKEDIHTIPAIHTKELLLPLPPPPKMGT